MVRRNARAAWLLAAGLVLGGLCLQPSCRKWDNQYDPTGNRPPAVPSGPVPTDGATRRDTGVVLAWSCSDPDSRDVLTYEVYFGATTPPARRDTWQQSATDTLHGLAFSTLYYWRVVARDNHGDTTAGPVWSFGTAAANHAPDAPSSPVPPDSAVGLAVHPALSWVSADPDTGDTVVYDVYFGTTLPLAKVVAGQSQTTFRPGTLGYLGSYYWQIVARDNHGAETPGPVWRFATMAPITITAPAAGEVLRMNTSYTLRWTGGSRYRTGRGAKPRRTGSGAVRSQSLAASDSTVVEYTTDNGSSWARTGLATTPGSFDWSVPGVRTDRARVRVSLWLAGDTAIGISGLFSIHDTVRPSPVAVTSPTSSSRWTVGTTQNITWTGGTDGVDSTAIYYSPDSGTTWSWQGRAATPGLFSWVVANPASARALIQVRAYNYRNVALGTSARFTVLAPPYPDSVVATVNVGSKPAAVVWDSVDNKVFVANYQDSNLTVINCATSQVTGNVRVGLYVSSLCWNATDDKVYAASELSRVYVVNAASNSVDTTLNTGNKPLAVCWNATDNRVYTANNRDSSVTVIDGATDSVVATVQVRSSPTAICWNRTADKVYVADNAATAVTVIDGAADTVLRHATVGVSPRALVVDDVRNHVYCANQGSNPSTVTVISGDDNLPITTVTVDPSSQSPWALAFNPVDSKVYVAVSLANKTTIINSSTYQVAASPAVGTQPRAVVWYAPADKVYVANNGAGSVSIIDGTSNLVVKTLTVGTKPTAFCCSTTSNLVYVANYDGNTVSVIGPH